MCSASWSRDDPEILQNISTIRMKVDNEISKLRDVQFFLSNITGTHGNSTIIPASTSNSVYHRRDKTVKGRVKSWMCCSPWSRGWVPSPRWRRYRLKWRTVLHNGCSSRQWKTIIRLGLGIWSSTATSTAWKQPSQTLDLLLITSNSCWMSYMIVGFPNGHRQQFCVQRGVAGESQPTDSWWFQGNYDMFTVPLCNTKVCKRVFSIVIQLILRTLSWILNFL